MRQLTYAMRFTGQATLANDAGTVLNASTTSFFFVDGTGTVTDHQFSVLLVP